MEISFAGIILTGPIKPDCCSGESFFHKRQVVNVKRPVELFWPDSNQDGHDLRVPSGLRSLSSGNCSSPIILFGQRLTTLISNLFSPGFKNLVISVRNGGFQSVPRSWPLSWA